MIAVDTQLPVFLSVETPESGLVRSVFGKESDWHVPVLWRSEYRNALLSYLRKGLLTRAEAFAAAARATALFEGAEHVVDSSAVLHVALDLGLTAYDAEYVVVARSLGVLLVTYDKQVLRACPDVAIHPRDFLALP